MTISNIILIVLVLGLAIAIVYFYTSSKKKAEVVVEVDVDDKTYTLDQMIKFIKKRLDEITKIICFILIKIIAAWKSMINKLFWACSILFLDQFIKKMRLYMDKIHLAPWFVIPFGSFCNATMCQIQRKLIISFFLNCSITTNESLAKIFIICELYFI